MPTERVVRELIVRVKDDTAQASAGLAKIRGELSSTGAAWKVAGAAAVGLGVAAAVGMAKAVDTTVRLAGETRTLARQLGITAEDASRLRAAGAQLGITTDDLARGFGIFEKHLVDGGAAFTKYGISLTDNQGRQKSFKQLLAEAADKYRSLGQGVQGTAFALDVFGRSGKTLLPLLAQGSAGLAAMGKEADALGLVMSQRALDAARALGIQEHQLGEAFQGLGISIGESLVPVVTTVVHAMTVGVEVFNEIPGPLKAGALAVTALAASFIGLGLAIGVAKKGLAGWGIDLAASRAATAGAATQLTLFETEQAGVSLGLGGLAAAAAPAVAGVAALAGVVALANKMARDQAKQLQADREVIVQYGKDSANAAQAVRDLERSHQAGGLRAPGAMEDVRAGAAAAAKEIDGLQAAYEHSSDAAIRAAYAAAQEKSGLEGITQGSRELHSAIVLTGQDWPSFQAKMQAAFEAGGQDLDTFVSTTLSDFTKWRSGLASSLNFAAADLGTLAGKSKLTAGQILKDFDQQLKAGANYRRNWDEVAREGGARADGLLAAIANMGTQGATILEALAKGNKHQVDQLVFDWNAAGRQAQTTSGDIASTLGSTLSDIRGILKAIARKWGVTLTLDDSGAKQALADFRQQLASIPGIRVPVNPGFYTAAGAVFAAAEGGITRGPTLLVGEGGYSTPFGTGSEIVSGAGVMPLSEGHIIALGRAIAAEIGKAGGGKGSAGRTVVLQIHGDVYTTNSDELARNLAPALKRELERMEVLEKG